LSLLDGLVLFHSLDAPSGDEVADQGTNTLVETGGAIASVPGPVEPVRAFNPDDTAFLSGPTTSLPGGNTNWTLAAVVRVDTFTATRGLFHCGWVVAGATTRTFRCTALGTQKIVFVVGRSTTQILVESADGISPGVWATLFMGHDAVLDQIWVSINGGPATTTTTSGQAPNAVSEDLVLGALEPFSLYLDGALDTFAAWDRRLTPEEMLEFYNGGSSLSHAKLVSITPTPDGMAPIYTPPGSTATMHPMEFNPFTF
jgi:hypothetical protein